MTDPPRGLTASSPKGKDEADHCAAQVPVLMRASHKEVKAFTLDKDPPNLKRRTSPLQTDNTAAGVTSRQVATRNPPASKQIGIVTFAAGYFAWNDAQIKGLSDRRSSSRSRQSTRRALNRIWRPTASSDRLSRPGPSAPSYPAALRARATP